MTDPSGPLACPRATYRLQFNKDFTFADAQACVPYLAALGVSHIYASPLLMARPGSTHGYDIVDHNRLNPEIGDESQFDALLGDLRRHGIGFVLDFVPNHMGVGLDNPWWVDVLEWGETSPFSGFFDIDWDPLEESLAGKVLLPVLGDHYGAVLDRGELRLCLDEQRHSLAVCYFDNRFPVAPRHYPRVLAAAATRGGEADAALAPLVKEFDAVLTTCVGARRKQELYRRVNELKQRFALLCAEDATIRRAVLGVLDGINGQPGRPESFDQLHRLLERQAYRLAYWRVASHEINYRRFFDINDLAALCMERPQVFEACHRRVAEWIGEGKLQGLRLDHVDGLREPVAYLRRLQDLVKQIRTASGQEMEETRNGGKPFYVLVEKILASHESLRRDWPVAGTTGYEFMSLVNGIFVDPAGERRLTRYFHHFVGTTDGFPEVVRAAKRQIIQDALASELHVLANLFHKLAKQSRNTRDYALTSFREALANVAVYFPVYRTYVTEAGASPEDRRDLDWALAGARRASRAFDKSIYDFIYRVLTLDILDDDRAHEYRRRDIVSTALKFQQFTGPLMAKSVEDTAFYRYPRLVSLNDVGGEPAHFGTSLAAFHEANRRRLREFPFSMLATATHDHKRGEDVRARLNVLSEVPSEWARRVRRWVQLNARKRKLVDGGRSPDANDEYLFYQTVVGTWPNDLRPPDFEGIEVYRRRLRDYALKAAREAKLRTNWAAPDEAYEQALLQFVDAVLDPKFGRSFLEDARAFAERVALIGAVNSLGQTLLKHTVPGVPDTYQGTELWDLSLVDPDNRRPVDYALRQRLLSAPRNDEHATGELLAGWRDGRVKQYVVERVLQHRRQHPELFAEGSYDAVPTSGAHAERVVAFARQRSDERMLVVAARFAAPLLTEQTVPLPVGWEDTALLLSGVVAGDIGQDVLSGHVLPLTEELRIADVLKDLPVALLVVRKTDPLH